MSYSIFDARQSKQIIDLFTRAFRDSEGEEKGNSVGHFVSELMRTNAAELFGFVATDLGKVVAGIFFSRLTFQNSTNAFILSPVAVDLRYQGKGVGQHLISFGIQHLKEHGVELVFTYGDPNFYQKVGFNLSAKNISSPSETNPSVRLARTITHWRQNKTDSRQTPVRGSLIQAGTLVTAHFPGFKNDSRLSENLASSNGRKCNSRSPI